jgi:hypothetical protein
MAVEGTTVPFLERIRKSESPLILGNYTSVPVEPGKRIILSVVRLGAKCLIPASVNTYSPSLAKSLCELDLDRIPASGRRDK